MAVDGGGVVYRSADAGATWTAALSAPPDLDRRRPALRHAARRLGHRPGVRRRGALPHRRRRHHLDAGPRLPGHLRGGGLRRRERLGGGRPTPRSIAPLDDGATLDGGASFPEARRPLQDLDFWDASIGYAVGGGGYAVRSGDGGLTWQILPTPDDTDQLTDIALIGPDELWVSDRRRPGALLGDGRTELGGHGRRSGRLRRLLDDRRHPGRGCLDRRLAGCDPSFLGAAAAAGQPAAGRLLHLPDHRARRSRSPTPAATPTARSPAGCGTSATAPPRPSSTRRTSSRWPAPTSSP